MASANDITETLVSQLDIFTAQGGVSMGGSYVADDSIETALDDENSIITFELEDGTSVQIVISTRSAAEVFAELDEEDA